MCATRRRLHTDIDDGMLLYVFGHSLDGHALHLEHIKHVCVFAALGNRITFVPNALALCNCLKGKAQGIEPRID